MSRRGGIGRRLWRAALAGVQLIWLTGPDPAMAGMTLVEGDGCFTALQARTTGPSRPITNRVQASAVGLEHARNWIGHGRGGSRCCNGHWWLADGDARVARQ